MKPHKVEYLIWKVALFMYTLTHPYSNRRRGDRYQPLRGACSVVVSTSAWLVGGPGSVPGHGMVFGVKTWLSTLATCILHESEKHVNVGPVLVWGVKEPLRTVTVATYSVSIDKSA